MQIGDFLIRMNVCMETYRSLPWIRYKWEAYISSLSKGSVCDLDIVARMDTLDDSTWWADGEDGRLRMRLRLLAACSVARGAEKERCDGSLHEVLRCVGYQRRRLRWEGDAGYLG